MQVRSDSINESERSIEAVLVTENAVEVIDWQRREVIHEMLLLSGMRAVQQVPLLDNHSRWSNDDVLGSVRNIRAEGANLVVRMYFADMSGFPDDPNAQRVERNWARVRQRHQREVSAGYRVLNSVTIPAGQSQVINGRTYRAGDRTLRVVTDWRLTEGSLTPIPADPATGTRNEETEMNPLLRYLISIGLRSDATLNDAWEYVSRLTDPGQRSEARRLIEADSGITPPESVRTAMQAWSTAPSQTTGSPGPQQGATNPPASGASQRAAGEQPQTSAAGTGTAGGNGPNPEQTRSASSAGPAAGTVGTAVLPSADVAEVVRQQLAAERARSAQVTQMFTEAGIDNQPLLQRAIAEGWDQGRAAMEILPLVRQRSSQPLDNSGHVAIHTRQAPSLEALGLAMMLRNGVVGLDDECFGRSQARAMGVPPVMLLDVNNDQRQRAMEQAHQFASEYTSLVDFCRMGLQLSGERVPHNRDEMVRAAISSIAVGSLFTADVNARLLKSYTDAEDTTVWCRSEDRADFKINEGITMGKFGPLTVHSAGKTADHLDTDTESYQYRLYRFSGQFAVDEMDIINDMFGALEQNSPEDIGLSAAQIRPNWVYSTLLANATFNGTALFHADRNNVFSGAGDAMSIGALEAALVAFGKIRIKTRPLNLMLKYLLVPHDLYFATETILTSAERRNTTASTDYGVKNVVSTKGITVVADDRLGVNGCTHPVTGTAYTGTATNWFAAATPGQNGAKTIVCGYRRGTNRSPQIRRFVMDQGRWGIGWDINLDMGVGVEDYRAMQKHAGA